MWSYVILLLLFIVPYVLFEKNIRLFFTTIKVKRIKRKYRKIIESLSQEEQEEPRVLQLHECDIQEFYSADQEYRSVFIRIATKPNELEVTLSLTLENKEFYHYPTVGTSTNKSNPWKSKDFFLSVIEPFKKLRIHFNGFLQNGRTLEMEYVRCNFIWTAADRPLYYPQDFPAATFANWISSENDFMTNQIGYDQFGSMSGSIMSDLGCQLEFDGPSYRKRRWACDNDERKCFSLFFATANQFLYNISLESYNEGCIGLKYGSVLDNRGNIHPIDQHDLQLSLFKKPSCLFRIKACGKVHECIIQFSYNEPEVDNLRSIQLDGVEANGITNFRWEENSVMVARLNEIYCQKISISGGKGSSLSRLTEISGCNFIVPDGFIVSTFAFRRFCDNWKIRKILKELEEVAYKNVELLEETCRRVEDEFLSTSTDWELQKLIVRNMLKIVVADDTGFKVAVRSSSVDEDGEEVTFAGQNATFLQCSPDEVMDYVKKCWISLYSFQSVEYRRYNGLPIISTMAVVVQKMVQPDSAGVIFGCNPTDGDKREMIINANYGLGEDVVSGKTVPDTYMIKTRWRAQSVQVVTSGTKSKERGSQCLTDSQIYQLGRFASNLEKLFTWPQDIEWALQNDQFYLLQSRPITTLHAWTDLELRDEFDKFRASDKALLTRANAGEVMPGAVTVLTASTIVKLLDSQLHRVISNADEEPFVPKMICTFRHQTVLDVFATTLRYVAETVSISQRVTDLAVFGRLITDDRLLSTARSMNGSITKWKSFVLFVRNVKAAMQIKKQISDMMVDVKKIVPTISECDNVEVSYQKIEKMMERIKKIMWVHQKATQCNVFYQILTLTILASGQDATDFSQDLYNDIASILSSTSDTVSAEIPTALKKIATSIKKHEKYKEFLEVGAGDGESWLKNNVPEAYNDFKQFLIKHGHRSSREFELSETSWGQNPSLVISMLQANCKSEFNNRSTSAVVSVEETVRNLVTPKSNVVRFILKFLIRKCRDSVRNREQTKSEVVRVVNNLRHEFSLLSRKMVTTGRLPEENLIHHLTFYEIKQILNGKKRQELLQKAIRRRRLYPEWNKFQLPELISGDFYQREHEYERDIETECNLQLNGTPVFPGNITARACVIDNLDEIHLLQPGDILITRNTDIGWSPYFPILGGVVTELGGLISHGAVVAREYGLPCVIAVENATKYFNTDDIVSLSGKTGVVKLIQKKI